MTKKIAVFLSLLLLTPLITGLYGVLHDQVTYTIAPEYFTKFKFYQFHIEEFIGKQERIGAAIVGFEATWWMGVPIALLLGMMAFVYPRASAMWANSLHALLLCTVVTILIPCIGVPLWYALVGAPQNIPLPAFVPEHISLVDKAAYALVGTIHNFSYLGGLIGLAVAMLYQSSRIIRVRRLARTMRKQSITPSEQV